MTNYKKLILTTVLWTITALILILAMIIFIMIFVFPKNLGDFFYTLGSNKLASSMYMRAYNKNGDIYYCYKALNIEITIGNNSRIIKLYETFENDEDYSDFISQLKERNEKLDIGILEKSSLLNENDYLKNRYIKALIGNGDTQKAYTLSLNEFKSYKTFSFKNQGVYAFHHFLNIQGFNDFEISPAGYDGKLIDCIKDYFQSSINLFDENKANTSNLDKSYLIALGNRILQVGQNINTICKEESETIQSNNLKMSEINDFIKGLL